MSLLTDVGALARVVGRNRLWRGSVRGRAATAAALARGRRDFLVTLPEHARTRPDDLALDDGTQRLTWADLAHRIERAAAGLHRLGLRPGDRFALALANRAEHVVGFGAALELGAVVAPMSPASGPAELRDRLPRCRLALVEPGLALAAASALPDPWRAIVVEDAPPDTTSWRTVASARGPARRGRPRADRPDVVLYTSGTTGRSKGARISTRGANPVTAFRYVDRLGLGPDTVLWTPCPLYHAAPYALAGLTMLMGGAVGLDRRFDDEHVVERLLDLGVTHGFLVPALLDRLVRRPDGELRALRRGPLRALVSSGAPLRGELKRRIQDRLGPVLFDMYGATELGLVAIGGPAHNAVQPDAVGPVLPGLQAEIRDDDGLPVAPGEAGELFVRSDTVSVGYEGGPTQAKDRWAGSGDLARLDPHGFLHVVGRKKEMVVSGGVNLFPGEIEAVLATHPQIRDVAVAGVPDERWGEALHAWIVAEAPAPDTDAVKAWIREHLAAYKAPRVVHHVDALPRTATGKVLKRVLVASVG